MRILRPEQVRLIACGQPATPANRSSSDSSQSSTSNSYADKRNAVQNGIGVSGDGNNTSYSSYSVSTDAGSVQAALSAAIAAVNAAVGGNSAVAANAIGTNGAVAANANSTMAQVSGDVVSASQHLADVGLSMLQSNTALANSLTGGALQSAQATTQIAANLAQTQVAAQNDNRYLIAAGMAVVAIVGVMAFKGKA